jgi:hypothetical protein
MHVTYATAVFVAIILAVLALADWLLKRFPKGDLQNKIQWKYLYARVLCQDAFFANIEQSLQDSLKEALSVAEHINEDGKATVETLTKHLADLEAACIGASKALQEIPGYKPASREYGDYIFM